MTGTGVFLCTCGKELNRVLNFKKIAKKLKGAAELVEVADYLCQRDLCYITQHLRWEDERKLDRVVVAACSPGVKGEIFRDVLLRHGLEEESLVLTDIREGCAWVHRDGRQATEKAFRLVSRAVEFEPPEAFTVKTPPHVLIYGGSEALRISQQLSSLGIESVVVSNMPFDKQDHGLGASCSPVNRQFLREGLPPVLFPFKMAEVKGKLGGFEAVLEREKFIDPSKCIGCGRCREACPNEAISYSGGPVPTYYINPEKCNGCMECMKRCSVDAINLEREVVTVETGQVISLYKGVEGREGVYSCWDAEKERRIRKGNEAMLRVAAYVNGVEKYNRPGYLRETCANLVIKDKELSVKGCEYCSSSCPYGVVSFDRGLVIDGRACVGCGICQSVCPTGSMSMRVHTDEDIYSKIEAAVRWEVEPKVLVFTCGYGRKILEAAGSSRLSYPVVIPLSVPCLGYLRGSHILRAIELGIQGVFLMGCNGGKCGYGKGFKRAADEVKIVWKILDAFGLGKGRVMIIAGSEEKPQGFVRKLKEFVGRLEASPLGGEEAKPLNLGKTMRDVLVTQLSGLKEKLGEPGEMVMEGADIPFGRVMIDMQRCVNCGACASHCNTGALTTGETRGYVDILNFSYPHCIACGICRDICPEGAIKIRRVLDLRGLISGDKVSFESEMLRCAKCGEPYISRVMYEKIRSAIGAAHEALNYCADCREDSLLNDLFEDSERDG